MNQQFRQFTLFVVVALAFSVIKPLAAQASSLTDGIWTTSCAGHLIKLPIAADSDKGALEVPCVNCVLCSTDCVPDSNRWLSDLRRPTGPTRRDRAQSVIPATVSYFNARAP